MRRRRSRSRTAGRLSVKRVSDARQTPARCGGLALRPAGESAVAQSRHGCTLHAVGILAPCSFRRCHAQRNQTGDAEQDQDNAVHGEFPFWFPCDIGPLIPDAPAGPRWAVMKRSGATATGRVRCRCDAHTLRPRTEIAPAWTDRSCAAKAIGIGAGIRRHRLQCKDRCECADDEETGLHVRGSLQQSETEIPGDVRAAPLPISHSAPAGGGGGTISGISDTGDHAAPLLWTVSDPPLPARVLGPVAQPDRATVS